MYQKDTIGDFWNFLVFILEPQKIKLYGVELPWTYGAKKPMEYLIGVKPFQKHILEDKVSEVKKKYPDAVFKKVNLPNDGWKIYKGKTKDLANLYKNKIFKECIPLHAIEEFNDDGTCIISIYPEKKN